MRHPCFNIWYGDFRAKTGHLSGPARAFYLVLLCEAWSRGGSLPNDDRALRLMLGLSAYQWAGIRDQVMAFWTLAEDGRWHNKRLDKEWKKAERRFKDEPLARAIAREETPADQQLSDRGEKASLKSLINSRSAARGSTTKNAAKSTMGPKSTPEPPPGHPENEISPRLSEKLEEPRAKNPAISTRARPDDPFPNKDLSASSRERSLSEAQSPSEPAAALSVGHAAQPAQDTPLTPSNGADPMPDQDAIDRVTAAMARLKADMADKNLAAFERPPLEGAPAPQGATQEERDRAEAEARLQQILALRVPLPKFGQRS